MEDLRGRGLVVSVGAVLLFTSESGCVEGGLVKELTPWPPEMTGSFLFLAPGPPEIHSGTPCPEPSVKEGSF